MNIFANSTLPRRRRQQTKGGELAAQIFGVVGTIGFYVFLVLCAFLSIFPFIWSSILSTRTRTEIFSSELSLALGNALFENYQSLVDTLPFWTSMLNSFYVTGLGTVVSILFCSMGGYAFAIYKFRGKNFIFGTMVASMMVPPILGLIPYYMIVQFLGLLNTHVALWLPFTATPFAIFLVRQYVVSSIPRELIESARIDGAGEWSIYFRIALPLMKPVLGTVAIVQFVFFWNNFLGPLVILSSQDKYVVTLALRTVQGLPNTPWGAVMLGTTISILPIVTFYLFASRQMISGLTSGAVKG
ncbi:carbohydrate ABC transporter permease [Agarivorans albus]|uniref:sn-glycerol-3-phosphate transport system permease protein UgpE n=1 Tax=Agarivorans albus MKT 106 TaxID=1331007 RepID=R9PHN1_AGAAL|nr:carbohydrate ABC transporter permease [Agarivorans albus]GAD00899.1 ABC-type sugar transport system [Agarivorans albus MKT 106]